MMYLSEGSKHVWFTDTASPKKNAIYTRITLAANTTTTIFTFIHLGLMTANHTMAYHWKSLHPVKQKKSTTPCNHRKTNGKALTHIKLRMKHAKGSQLESWIKVTLGTGPGLLIFDREALYLNIYDQLVVYNQTSNNKYLLYYHIIIYILHILYIPYKLQSM